jgi:alpha-tubulin suppressor-like RCC1 family protein/sugar lactone lactonase YvrE
MRRKKAIVGKIIFSFLLLSLACSNPIQRYFQLRTEQAETAAATLITPTPTITPTNTPTPIPRGTPIGLVSGWNGNCVIRNSDPIKCWGGNEFGQLGDNTSGNNRAIPVDVTVAAVDTKAVALSISHTCILTVQGGVKCWGDNTLGQLGNGDNESSLRPVDVVGLSDGVISLAANQYITCAVTSNGGAKCWGANRNGQLGDGTTTDRNIPVNVKGLADGISALAVGPNHACALSKDGKVKCWGQNQAGQLGDGTKTDSSTPVEVKGLSDGVKGLAVGWDFSCAQIDDSGVQCWGANNWGQLGDGTTVDKSSPVDVVGLEGGVQELVLGDSHTCVLSTTGSIKCWGENYSGELGNQSTDDFKSMPVDVVGITSVVRSISAGGGHTCALLDEGGVKCWGWNSYGQLGNGSIANSNTPVDVVWSADEAADPYAVNIRTSKAAAIFGKQGYGVGEFQIPRGIALASDGSFYVADTMNHRVQHLDSTGSVLQFWGTFSGDTAGTANAPAATFDEPWGIAVGKDGAVYVADTWNGRIQKFSSEGKFIKSWGSPDSTDPKFQLYGPRSIAVDPEGRVFVVDTGDKRIMVYDPNGNYLMQIGEEGSGEGQFDEPVGIAFGKDGQLYVADAWNKRIQIFQKEGQNFVYQSEWPVKSWTDDSTDRKPYLSVAPDGNVWVTDPWSDRVLVFTPTGAFLFSFGHSGSNDSSFSFPSGIAIGSDGKVYIADSGNNRVMEFDFS